MSTETWSTAAPSVSWSPLKVRHVLHGPTMGTRYSAVFLAPSAANLHVIGAGLQLAVDQVDAQMSNWKPQSDVSRLNASGIESWVRVAGDLLEVVETGLSIGRLSGGVFDIGVGKVVDDWGFGPTQAQPDTNAITTLMPQRKAADLLELDRRNSLIRKHGQLVIDLCGIAKGFGVDQLARCLDNNGVDNYLVSIDGELRARGCRLDGAPWTVGIERPDRHGRSVASTVALRNQAIATSGDYRHWHNYNGRLISHTIDPRTARPVENGLASVSVVAANAMIADAWATALLVAGETLGPDMAVRHGLSALFIVRRGDDLLELGTGQFA